MNFTFRKEERLCSRKDIEALILKGSSSFLFPFKIHWKSYTDKESTVKIAFAVPKKRFKRANKRNTIKRRIREAYRLNKHILTDPLLLKNIQLNLLLVYISNEVMNSQDLEKKIKNALEFILAEIQKTA